MHLRDWLFFKRQGLRRRLGVKLSHPTDGHHHFAEEAQNFRRRSLSELGEIFFDHDGRGITKWVDYLDHYDRHFCKYRGTPVKLLEIGIFRGGSLELWRKYFGADAVLFGIDIDKSCLEKVDGPNQVRIGSQDDADFLSSVVSEMGAPDIILDDGSHKADHQLASFKALWPLLTTGGLYVIEDLHTAYWPGEWAGGFGRKGTAIETVKRLIDDMHGWWHTQPEGLVDKSEIGAIHMYESIVFIEKVAKELPSSVEIGQH
jgi:cephalosporin hydroxylase